MNAKKQILRSIFHGLLSCVIASVGLLEHVAVGFVVYSFFITNLNDWLARMSPNFMLSGMLNINLVYDRQTDTCLTASFPGQPG